MSQISQITSQNLFNALELKIFFLKIIMFPYGLYVISESWHLLETMRCLSMI